jgi:hypothetical protein
MEQIGAFSIRHQAKGKKTRFVMGPKYFHGKEINLVYPMGEVQC